ncbi:MAG: alpha/beta fold hydrolase [Acidimicrobiales bacterium]|nr:alpha/beta fold hydrolase [Acidimicrobiales bacterium]
MGIREDIEFNVNGERIAAWFYYPDGPKPYKAMVLAHGLGATKECSLDQYALRFQEAGYAVLVFDYRGFGDSGVKDKKLAQLISVRRQLQDWRGAIDYLRTRNDIDHSNIGIWGTSFSGGHVLKIASQDPRIKVVISQIPNVDTFASISLIEPKTQPIRLAIAGIKDLIMTILGRPGYSIPIVGEPGELAMLSSSDAMPGLLSISPETGINSTPARSNLLLPLYRPITSVKKIKCPVLYCIAKQDKEVSSKKALTAAGKTANATVKEYEGGHFAPYNPPLFETVIKDQLEYLKENL